MNNFNKLKSNQQLFLNDPQTIWIVKSGILGVFTTLFKGQKALENHRYLFTVNTGEALFGATPKEQRGILAIALEEAELIPASVDQFMSQIQAGDRTNLTLLSSWIQHWQELGIKDFPINSQTLEISAAKINQFHQELLDYLNLAEIQKKAEQFQRFQEREHLNRQVRKASLGELTKVLHPHQS